MFICTTTRSTTTTTAATTFYFNRELITVHNYKYKTKNNKGAGYPKYRRANPITDSSKDHSASFLEKKLLTEIFKTSSINI